VVVLVVFPALAYAGITLLSDWDGFSGDGDPSDEELVDAGDVTGDEGATPEESVDPAATPTEAPVETPAPPPADMARPVEVYNSTNQSGLASNGADRLEAAGFTDVTSGNWAGEDPAASIVYYSTAADITTAQLVASTLGLATVQESVELAPAGVVAVLASDYTAT
jgi:hypothetical protein